MSEGSSGKRDPAFVGGPGDVRCCCGSLLARLLKDGVELKCRRCKRIVFLDFRGELVVKERSPPDKGVSST